MLLKIIHWDPSQIGLGKRRTEQSQISLSLARFHFTYVRGHAAKHVLGTFERQVKGRVHVLA